MYFGFSRKEEKRLRLMGRNYPFPAFPRTENIKNSCCMLAIVLSQNFPSLHVNVLSSLFLVSLSSDAGIVYQIQCRFSVNMDWLCLRRSSVQKCRTRVTIILLDCLAKHVNMALDLMRLSSLLDIAPMMQRHMSVASKTKPSLGG